MRVWYGYGSEHSANLVMIGHFQSVGDATKASEIIESITRQVRSDEEEGKLKIGDPPAHYGDAILDLLGKLNVATIGPNELVS
jgi:hypothetical protein